MNSEQFVPEVLTDLLEAWTGTALVSIWKSQAKAYQRHEHLNSYGKSDLEITLYEFIPRDTEESEIPNLVDFGDVAFSVESAIRIWLLHTNMIYTYHAYRLHIYRVWSM